MTRSNIYSLVVGILLFGVSCESSSFYEENRDFQGAIWRADSTQTYEFEILNRNLKYDVIINLRNTLSYSYRNIYLNYVLKNEEGNVVDESLVEFDLFDKAGKPLGTGAGDIFSNALPLLEDYGFSEPGIYSLSLTQYMRQDSLKHIISLGVRIESSQLEIVNDSEE